MADLKKKISELPAGTPLDTDVIPYVDILTNTTKKALKSELKGDKWDTGDAATATAGTTTTGLPWTDASVTNVGTLNDAIFDFVIPRGDVGAKWDKWDKWDDGLIVSVTGTMVDNTDPANPVILSDSTKANDNEVVHTTGNETISGTKTFTSEVIINSLPVRETALNATQNGRVSGVLLSWTNGTSSISISSGVYVVTDWSAWNFYKITFAGLNTSDAFPSQPFTHIFLNSTGNIVMQSTAPTRTQIRDNLYIGVIAKASWLITDWQDLWHVSYDTYTAQDWLDFIGSVQDGDILLSGNSWLTMSYSAGVIIRNNANSKSDVKTPNYVVLSAKNPVSMTYYWRDGAGWFNNGSKVTTFPVWLYDDGDGTLATYTTNFGIYYFGLSTNGEILVAYPQTTYVTLAAAKTAIVERSYNPILSPQFKKIVKLAKVIVKGNATSLNDDAQRYIENLWMTLGWNSGGGGSSGAGGDFFWPASSTTDNLVSFADTTGKVGKDSGIATADLVLIGEAQNVVDKTFIRTMFSQFVNYSQFTIATSGGTFTIATNTQPFIFFTGTANHNIVLPAFSAFNTTYYIGNESTGVITVKTSGSLDITTLAAGEFGIFTTKRQNSSAGVSSWAYDKWNADGTPKSGGGNQSEPIADYSGQAMIGILGTYIFTSAKTLARCSITADSIPTGSNLIVELRKNSSTSGNVLSSTLQIATSDTLTNGKKTVSITDNDTFVAGDYVVAYLTSVGSTLPALNPVVTIDFS